MDAGEDEVADGLVISAFAEGCGFYRVGAVSVDEDLAFIAHDLDGSSGSLVVVAQIVFGIGIRLFGEAVPEKHLVVPADLEGPARGAKDGLVFDGIADMGQGDFQCLGENVAGGAEFEFFDAGYYQTLCG